jgi:hypothetical protein
MELVLHSRKPRLLIGDFYTTSPEDGVVSPMYLTLLLDSWGLYYKLFTAVIYRFS